MSVILFISLIDFILSSLAWVYYSHAFSFLRSTPFIILYVALMLNTVGSRMLSASLPLPLLKLSAWLSGYWIAFLYYSLLLMVLHGIIYSVLRILSFKLPFTQFAAAGAVFLVIFIAWGSWRAFSPVVRTETVVSAKLPPEARYKIVLVSDIHLGRELGYEYSKGLVQLINAQQPDLVLVPDWTDLNFVELLRGAKVPVYVYKTPTTVKEIKQTICELANVVDERVAGGKIVAKMEKELAFVQARVGNMPAEECISVMALSYMGPFGARGTTFADICNYANVRNVVAEYDLPPNATFSEETLIRLNPDLLVIPSWKYDNEQDPSKMREEILQNRAYQSVNAVKNKRVVQLRDTYLYSTTHYIVYAIRDLAEAAYPERFK